MVSLTNIYLCYWDIETNVQNTTRLKKLNNVDYFLIVTYLFSTLWIKHFTLKAEAGGFILNNVYNPFRSFHISLFIHYYQRQIKLINIKWIWELELKPLKIFWFVNQHMTWFEEKLWWYILLHYFKHCEIVPKFCDIAKNYYFDMRKELYLFRTLLF